MDFYQLGNQTVLGMGLSFAIQSGVIHHLNERCTIEELQKKSGLSVVRLRGLLSVLIELKLAETDGSTFNLTESAKAHFLKATPESYHFGTVLSELQKSHLEKKPMGFRRWWPFKKRPMPWNHKKFYKDSTHAFEFAKYASPSAELAGREISEIFDFSKFDKIYDLGGNDGSFLIPILKKFHGSSGLVVDIPAVKALVENRAQSSDLKDRLKFHAADFFFNPLPENSIYTSGYVLHDWPQHYSEIILRKLAQAIPSGGILILHENLLDDPRPEIRKNFVTSNYVMVTLGENGAQADGERTSEEYKIWLQKFGFELYDVKFGSQKGFLFFRKL